MFGLQYTFEEITDRVQASKQSVEQGLVKLQACQIKGSRYSCNFLFIFCLSWSSIRVLDWRKPVDLINCVYLYFIPIK